MKDFFDLLPEEIKFEIFSYLKTHEIQKVADALPSTKYLLGSERLFKKLNFYKVFGCTISDIQRVQCDIVTELNINCVYWIDAPELRKCIANFVNLTTLYAVDTKLALSKEDHVLYSKLPKLSVIGITMRDCETEDSINCPRDLKKLYLHLNLKNYNTPLAKFIKQLSNLEELWLVETRRLEDLNSTERELIYSILENLPESVQNFTCNLPDEIFIPRLEHTTFKPVYSCIGYCKYSKRGDFDIEQLVEDKTTDWKHVFQVLEYYPIPFGVKDVEKLSSPSVTLKNIQLEELKVDCLYLKHDERDYNFCKSITPNIIKNNLCFLKKLSIPAIFLYNGLYEEHYLKSELSVRGRRVSKLEQIIENCPLIEVLEISGDYYNFNLDVACLEPIQNLRKLESLTLSFIDVNFQNQVALVDICKKCPINTLRMYACIITPSPTFFEMLSKCIREAKNLKYFKFVEPDIKTPVDEIFEVFNSLENKTLEKIFVDCKVGTISSVDKKKTIRNFLTKNPQLLFVYLNLDGSLFDSHDKLDISFNKKPEQILVLERYSDDIPFIYKQEAVEDEMENSYVGIIDVLNGFSN